MASHLKHFFIVLRKQIYRLEASDLGITIFAQITTEMVSPPPPNAQTWQVLLTEIVGTGAFVAIILASAGNAIIIGAALAVLIMVGAPLSGAHYNPAVSTAFWLKKAINGNQLLAYVVAQLFGAFLGKTVFDWSTP